MPTEAEVKEAASQTALKEESKQSFENQAKEWQRKYTDLSDKYENVTSEIADLKEKVNLTRGDRERLEHLEDRKERIEDQKEKIKSDPNAKPWLSVQEDISRGVSSKTVSDALYDYDKTQAQKMVRRTAKEVKVSEKEFEDQIADILKGGRWKFDVKGNENMPTERVEMAIDEWHKQNELKSKAEKADEKSKVLEAERTGRRHETNPSKKETFERAKETGDFKDILAEKARRQAEFYK